MHYTVWSRRRLIGETELDFVRLIDRSRSGWFHPNAEGVRLMPAIASVLPAMRAYLHRDTPGNSIVKAAMHGSTLFADLAEAFHHLRFLDLDIRREDGSIVPASDVGIQDTRQLMELADSDEIGDDALDWDADVDLNETHEPEPPGGCDRFEVDLTQQVRDELVDEPYSMWTPGASREVEHPRFQIHVLLIDDDAIP